MDKEEGDDDEVGEWDGEMKVSAKGIGGLAAGEVILKDAASKGKVHSTWVERNSRRLE